MQQSLELPHLIPLIPDQNARPQRPSRQRDRVDQPELSRPRRARFRAQVLRPEPEIKLHAVIAAPRLGV